MNPNTREQTIDHAPHGPRSAQFQLPVDRHVLAPSERRSQGIDDPPTTRFIAIRQITLWNWFEASHNSLTRSKTRASSPWPSFVPARFPFIKIIGRFEERSPRGAVCGYFHQLQFSNEAARSGLGALQKRLWPPETQALVWHASEQKTLNLQPLQTRRVIPSAGVLPQTSQASGIVVAGAC